MAALIWEEVGELPRDQGNQMERDAAYQFATCRARVPGGWMYRTWWSADNTNDRVLAQTFVPDAAEEPETITAPLPLPLNDDLETPT